MGLRAEGSGTRFRVGVGQRRWKDTLLTLRVTHGLGFRGIRCLSKAIRGVEWVYKEIVTIYQTPGSLQGWGDMVDGSEA